MIERYTREEMGRVWSPQNRMEKWLEVELLIIEGLSRMGEVDPRTLERIREKASFTVKRVNEIEGEIKHDLLAFVMAVGENLGHDSSFFHRGVTSSDILDTGLALQLKEAGALILKGIDDVMESLKSLSFRFMETPIMGRTHGVHAEPITFGLKTALWHEEMKRCRDRVARGVESVSAGKISGALGTYTFIPPEVEEFVLKRLGLNSIPISSQVIPRDCHGEFLSSLAILASVIERIAIQIRLMQRTGAGEVLEPFEEGQMGSSSMPHKRNPVLCENLTGLARLLRGYSVTALENIPLWDERDISHSGAERVIAPDASILADFMLHRLAHILKNLDVRPGRMMENIEGSRHLFASQSILVELMKRGVERGYAYRAVHRLAGKAAEGGEDLLKLLKKDEFIRKNLSEDELVRLTSPARYMKSVEHIFRKVFGEMGWKDVEKEGS